MFTAGELVAFGFTEELVDRIMRFLDTSALDLDGSKPDAVGQTTFGSGPASLSCATHAGKARQHVVEAINDMVTGLNGYHESIVVMKRQAYAADDNADADIQRILVQAEACAATPTVSTPSQCTPLETGATSYDGANA